MQILGTDDEPLESAWLLVHRPAASRFVVLLGLRLWYPRRVLKSLYT